MPYSDSGQWFPDNPDADNPALVSSGESEPDFSSNPVMDEPGDGFMDDGNDGDELVPVDPRTTYTNPDPTARQVGVEAGTGNPIWQLIDAGGNIVQWMIDAAGSAVGIQNLGSASGSGSAVAGGQVNAPIPAGHGTVAPPSNTTNAGGGTTSPPTNLGGAGTGITGNAAIDNLISNIMGGNNAGGSAPGFNISPQTVNYAPTTLASDSRVTTTNVINQNSPDTLNSLIGALKNAFGVSSVPPAPVTPSNDSVLGTANFPGGYSSGRPVIPGSPSAADSTIATVKGALPSASAVATPQNFLIVGAVLVVVVVLGLFLRKR